MTLSMDKIARSLALKSINDTTRSKNIPRTLQKIPTQMNPAPTVVLGERGGGSQIANGVLIPSVISNVPNPIFSYNGDPIKAADKYPDREFVKNGAVTTNSGAGDFWVEFDFDGKEFEYRENSWGAPRSRVLIDEGSGYQYVNSVAYADIPTNDGGIYLRKLTFAARMIRRIRIEVRSYFGGVYIGPNDTLTPSPKPSVTKALFFGDSFVEGTGADVFDDLSSYCSALLGWECWKSGSGGTGFINPGATGRVKYQDRVMHDVINYKPDIVVIVGGTNDTAYNVNDIQSAASLLFSTIKNELPEAKVIAYANPGIGSITPTVTNVKNAVKTAALQSGIALIDPVDGVTYDGEGKALISTGPWLTGGGDVSKPEATGNRSFYLHSDRGHPSAAGHRYIGGRIAAEILRIVAQH